MTTEKPESADAEMQRCLAVHPSSGQWPLGCARHHSVDFMLVILVERARGTSPHCDAQYRGKADNRMDIPRRREQSAKRREHDKAHHPWLGQSPEITPVGGQDDVACCGRHSLVSSPPALDGAVRERRRLLDFRQRFELVERWRAGQCPFERCRTFAPIIALGPAPGDKRPGNVDEEDHDTDAHDGIAP